MRCTPLSITLPLLALLTGGSAWADPQYRLMLQSRADGPAASEVFVTSYGSYTGLVASPGSVSGDFSGIDIDPGYQVAGLAYDGQYRLALSTRTDGPAGSELFIATYGSYADLANSAASVSGDFSGIDVDPAYRIAGLAYDGQYRLALTSRVDGAAGSELFIATYASYAALVGSPASVGGSFSGIDIDPSYEVASLTYDGQYRLALTTRTDGVAGAELFIATYDSFADLLNSPGSVGGDFSGIDIDPSYRVAALAFEPDPAVPPPPNGVPEPASAWLVLLGLGGLVGKRVHRARRAA
jgi:hypothetical protein